MANPEHVVPQADAEIFCSVLSREAGEPLVGTALHVDVWLLLEYEGPWGAKVTSENDLPPEVQKWLAMQAATLGRGRVQFIKQEREQTRDFLTFYVADARVESPRLFEFRLGDYRELLQIDVVALLDGEGAARDELDPDPLYLVCTNGRRDRCCALFGLEVYFALQAVAGTRVWQTTHVGGHRFAANVLTFPEGAYYGRVQEADVEAFYDARQRGEMALPFMRGRSCYEEVVQAADIYLRQETGESRLDAFVLRELQAYGEEQYEVAFDNKEGARFAVRLQRDTADPPIFASCGKPGAEPCYAYTMLGVEK